MFEHRVQCPVEVVDREHVEGSFAWLAERCGLSGLSGTVFLPTSEYFPGPFSGDADQMHALVNGVATAMGVGNGEGVTAVDFPRGGRPGPRGFTGCVGYPGGAYRGGDGGGAVALDEALADRPVALIATIAHMLGHLRFGGREGIPAQRPMRELLIELHAVYTGFGIFGANAAVERQIDAPRANRRAALSYGLSQDRPTYRHSGYLTEQLHGYALACFAFMRGETRPKWQKYLDDNPRAFMRQSLRYLEQHPSERLLTIQAGAIPRAGAQTPDVK